MSNAKKNQAKERDTGLASAVDGDESAEDAKPRAKVAAKEDRSHAGGKRLYKNTQEIDSDLFKLQVATMRKWDGVREDDQVFLALEHCHIFRTFDSNGKRQTQSTAVGGHFHLVEVIEGKSGVPEVRVSKPMILVRDKVRGKTVVRPMPISEHNPDRADDHTHEVAYIRSDRIKLRTPNTEFAKVEAALGAAAPSLPAGITG